MQAPEKKVNTTLGKYESYFELLKLKYQQILKYNNNDTVILFSPTEAGFLPNETVS